MQRILSSLRLVSIGVLSFLTVWAGEAAGQNFTRLQLLLPGELEAPGTASGKLGVPDEQTVGTPVQVRVRACDAQWNTIATVTDIVQLASSDASATLPGATALQNGERVLTVTFNANGTHTVSVTDETDPTIPAAFSSSVTVAVVQGFEFSRVNQKNQYAGVPMAISVRAVDPSGDTVQGFEGQVRLRQLTSFGEGRLTPEQVTLSHGVWSGSVTLFRADESSINRGNVNIYALLDSDPSKNGTSDPFTVHPGPFSQLQIIVPGQDPRPGSIAGTTGSPATQGAGQSFTVNAYATDSYWNPVPSLDVVRLISSDPDASTPTTETLANGFAQFVVSLATVGSQTLTISDQSNGSIQGMTSAPIPVIPSGVDHFVIEPFAVPVMAGDPISITIRATDANSNTIPDYSGDALLTANTGPGSISPEAISFTDGLWSGDVFFRGAGGAVSITCSDYSSPPHLGTSANFQVLPGPFAGLQVLLPGQVPQGGTARGFTGGPDDQNAGTTFQVTIRAVDAFWNRVPGIQDPIELTSSDPLAELPADNFLSNGQLVVPVTLFKAGLQTLTATHTDSLFDHTSSEVSILPGPYTRLLLLAPGETVAPGAESGRSGTATDQSINFAFTVLVYATDAWWNPIEGISDVIRLSSTDPLAQLPPDTAMENGITALNVRLSTGGFQQITASSVSQPAIPASTTQVRAISSGFHLEASVVPSAVQAGESFTLDVRVVNDAGSVIQEVNSFIDVEVQNATTREAGRGTLRVTRFQLLSGERSVAQTYTFAEPILLVVHDDAGNAPGVTGALTVSPGPPASVTLNSDPVWVRGNQHATLTARVVDAYDNGVESRPVRFEVGSGNGIVSDADSLTGEDGSARADFHAPRQADITHVLVISEAFVAELDVETALVDPNAPGGYVSNYPNPFHPDEGPTIIAYKLADNANVTLRVYTLSGGLVLERQFAPGSVGGSVGLNEFAWDGRNGSGAPVSSGGYLTIIEAVGAGETMHVMRRKIGVVR